MRAALACSVTVVIILIILHVAANDLSSELLQGEFPAPLISWFGFPKATVDHILVVPSFYITL